MHMHFYKKSWWAAGAVALFLAGCSNLPSPPQALVRYDLGAAPALVAASAPLQPIALAHRRFNAPPFRDFALKRLVIVLKRLLQMAQR